MTATAAQKQYITKLIEEHVEINAPRDMVADQVRQTLETQYRPTKAEMMAMTYDERKARGDANRARIADELPAAIDAWYTRRDTARAERDELISRRDDLTKTEASRLIDLLNGKW